MNLAEQQVFEKLVPQLVADGYTVYLEPSRKLLPPFMQGYVPDAIALRKDKNIAFEVISNRGKANSEVHLLDRFRSAPDWELRVLYARPLANNEELPTAGAKEIARSVDEAEVLLTSGHLRAALLLGWATLESLARSLIPERTSGPQSAQRLVETLAGEGHVTPDEADDLRRLAIARDGVIHGDLTKNISVESVQDLVSVLKALLQLV